VPVALFTRPSLSVVPPGYQLRDAESHTSLHLAFDHEWIHSETRIDGNVSITHPHPESFFVEVISALMEGIIEVLLSTGGHMYHHIKKLMYTVNVGTPDPRFGNMLLEQFGGANGELAAAMQYSIQGLNCEDLERKDLLMDIGTEELSHLEIVGTLARMHLKPMKKQRGAAQEDPLIAIAGGGGVSLFNSMGDAWTADYLKITGELDVDLRSNIAAEARAKIVYERLINFCDDPGTKDALQFLMTREITHMKAFSAALESLGKNPFSIGQIPPTPGLVDEYFNDSTGTGDHGEIDARGPWNEGGDWKLIEQPELHQGVESRHGAKGKLADSGAQTKTRLKRSA